MNTGPIVCISKAKTAEYGKVDFAAMVRSSLEKLEKAGVSIPSGGVVFVKPNVVIGATARESITTEPRFVAALIEILLERGVDKVYVGDSSAGYMRSRDTFKAAGMDKAVSGAGGIIVDIDAEEERMVLELPESDIARSLTVPRKALEADFLINFARLKTHRIGSMTCCVKNWVGFLSQDLRLQHHQTRLPKLVAELHKAMPEQLCFGDAVIVGEGDGPDLSRPRYLGVLLSSNDPVALDSIAADLLHIHKGDLVFPWTAHLEGVGEIDRNKIQVIGPSVESLAIEVEKPLEVLYNRFPCNIVLGGMCEGCFAWFIGPALFWQRDGIWQRINDNVGRPTFMLGFNAVDLNFEKHLEQGPYFVIGDCTPKTFQQDPRTVYIPGCCPGPAIPDVVLKTCKITESEGWK